MIKNKSKIIPLVLALTIAFNIILFTNTLIFESNVDNLHENTNDLCDLRLGDSEITITTPENKTYIEPMNGYYPGFYGFENDADGTLPDDWVDNSGSGCSGSVSAEKLGHRKVLHLDDDSGNKIYFQNNFLNQSYGTIEMWVLAEDCTMGFGIRLIDSISGERMAHLHFGINDKWGYFDGVTTQYITAFDGVYDPVDNTWYHVKIHFRCNGAPSYLGLN